MTTTFTQVRALALLLLRHLTRRSLRAGGIEATQGRARIPWFLLLTLAWVALIAQFLWTRFDHAATDPLTGAHAMSWQLLGVVLTILGYGLVELAPEHGTLRPPLRVALLDELPVTTLARLVLVWFRNPFVPALAALAALAWSPSARGSPAGALGAAAFGLLVFVALTTLGYAFATWTRVVARARGRRVISILAIGLVVVGLQPVVFADLLGAWTGLGGAFEALARSLRGAPGGPDGGADLAIPTAVFAALWVLALGAIALAERIGYDRLDAPRGGRGARSNRPMDLAATERILMNREGALGLVVLGWIFCLVIAGLAVLAFIAPPPVAVFGILGTGYGLAVAYTGAVVALSRAGAAVRRDAGVRAFLAPLPIAPFETLVGKVRALRWILLPVFVSGLPTLVVAIAVGSFELAWRTLVSLVAVWLGAAAAVSVAFLTGGVGLPGVRTLGAPTSLAVQLLMLPLLAAAAAPDLPSALAALVAVWAIAREARRAAEQAVRWIDDAADDLARDTTVWRALLGLGMFFAVRSLGGRALGLGDVDPNVKHVLVYSLAALVLVLVTVVGRHGLRTPWVSGGHRGGARTTWLASAMGAAAGLLAAIVAAAVVAPPHAAQPALTDTPLVLNLVLAVALVPLAEELFFRGWLQAAIHAELPPRHRRWSFLLGALAFALAHVGAGPIVPLIALGLVTGALFQWSRVLLPGLIAHAAYALAGFAL